MEIAIFLAMMIVPFISIAALILAISSMKRMNALKDLTLTILDRKPSRESRDMKDEFSLRSI